MKTTDQHLTLIRLIARILGIAFALFIGLFAMDVFTEHESLGKTILALGMHLVPVLVLLLVAFLSWRREWIGGVAYTLLGVAYIVAGKGKMDWTAYTLIAGPLFILGLLFSFIWVAKKQ